MEFIYRDSFNMEQYREYLNRKAVDCLCKHVCRITNPKAKALILASEAIGYPKASWGYGEGLHLHPEQNRLIQINRIQVFIYDRIVHPIRLVIDKEGEVWIDNLHSVLTQILCRGRDLELYAMPVYIVDMRGDIPKIVDGYHLIDFNREKIIRMLEFSRLRCERVSSEIKAIGYTIGEFMADNEINREALTLPSEDFYTEFIKTTADMMFWSDLSRQQIVENK